jgi:hypothetical protein
MIEPTILKLSNELLDNLTIEEIIYAEYAKSGAMGNAGGVMIYSITEDIFNCYETNMFTDKDMYNRAVGILKRNQIASRYNDTTNENGMFKVYDGSMGNIVLINKNISLKIENGCFILIKNSKEYKIRSSTKWVFMRVYFQLRRERLGYRKKIRKLKEYKDEAIDEAEKQGKRLYKKLDKKIVAEKTYTEKEINAILKGCCTSQDYVSFRRHLIDTGYLSRNNDCRAYWKNVK